MIAKKNPGVDLERKRVVIFNLGLLVAGSFSLAAFTYTDDVSTEQRKKDIVAEEMNYFELDEKEKEPVIKKVILKPQPKPEPPTQPQDQQVGSTTALTENMNVNNDNSAPQTLEGLGLPGIPNPPFQTRKVRFDDDIVIPEIDAEYVGGLIAMKEQIALVQEYPEIDKVMGNQGTVYVSFVVEKDGRITNVQTERGVSQTLDREAERIIKTFPKWIPGEDEYGVVRTRIRMPIKFILAG